MLIEHQHPENKSITLSVAGVYNAGKSTFINAFLGMDLSIVSSKAQTTRNKILCVTRIDRTEIIFIDTPGLHTMGKEINKRFIEQIREGTSGSDVVLFLIDLTRPILQQYEEFIKILGETPLSKTLVWAVFNKIDKAKIEALEESKVFFEETCGKVFQKNFYISGLEGTGMHELTAAICDQAPSRPHRFEDGSVSNRSERFFAAEYIREQAFEFLRDEIPHELGVIIDDYRESKTEKNEEQVHITASIIVNRPSQRAIVIGAQGSMIKKIGIYSRKKIEAMTGAMTHLNLHVKVLDKWFNNNLVLEQMELPRARDSKRVWRKK